MKKHFALASAFITTTLTGNYALADAKPIWPDVIVQLHGSGHAYIVDSASDRLVADLETCAGATLGATTPDAKKAYVSCAGEGQKEIVVLDLAERRVAKRIETGNRPKHGIVSPDGKWLGVNHWGLTDGKLRVSFIDTRTDEIARVIDLDVSNSQPAGVISMHNAWSVDSRYLFTMDRVDNRVIVVDTKDWGVKTHPSPSAPHYLIPTHDGKELWLVHEGDAKVMPGIAVFDLSRQDLPVVTRMEMPLIGESVVEAHHGNFTQDGKLFMALNRGPGKESHGREVAFFDARTKKLVHRITTASDGVGHAYNTPDGKMAVVTNYGNNVISIIDVRALKTVKDLKIGAGRMGHAAFSRDGRWGYVSNEKDGNLYKLDMKTLEVVKTIETGRKPGGGQVFNVWTNIFEELPRM